MGGSRRVTTNGVAFVAGSRSPAAATGAGHRDDIELVPPRRRAAGTMAMPSFSYGLPNTRFTEMVVRLSDDREHGHGLPFLAGITV